jgi:hypothetical protein
MLNKGPILAARSINLIDLVQFIRLFGLYSFNISVNTVLYENTVRFR